MSKIKFTSLAVGIVFAAAFTLSCSFFDDGKGESGSFADERDGKEYRTVVIGTQTWMAENLNYAVEGGKCYEDEQENCKTYGRLYDWVTATAIDSICYSVCPSQIQLPHQGICPAGWHIPSNEEWDKLYRFVDPDGVGNSRSEMAGKFLKAKSGWERNNGIDKYGFTALPGGKGSSYGSFSSVGYAGYWWSAIEYYSSTNAHYRRMHINDGNGASWGYDSKRNLYSVRCIKDLTAP